MRTLKGVIVSGILALTMTVAEAQAQVACAKNTYLAMDWETSCSGTVYTWSTVECQDGTSYLVAFDSAEFDNCGLVHT
jgi:hypothetical protein